MVRAGDRKVEGAHLTLPEARSSFAGESEAVGG